MFCTPVLVFLALSFLIGCVPNAYIFVKVKTGKDIRKEGSGNVGATNASRVLGKKLGLVVLLLDLMKGVVAAGLFREMLHWGAVSHEWWSSAKPLLDSVGTNGVGLVFGIAAFVGHCFNPFLGFKGGKGVATALGVYLVTAWWATLLTAVVCITIILLTKIVSIASIVGAVLLPISIVLFTFIQKGHMTWQDGFVVALTTLISVVVVFRHRSNIKRLLEGKENKAL
jgi:glycerol-3-phosphate acyltransferase PlsY